MQNHPRTRISKTAILGLIAVCSAYIMTYSVYAVLRSPTAADVSGRVLSTTHYPPLVVRIMRDLMIPLSIIGGAALSACGLVATKRDPTLRGRVLAWAGVLLAVPLVAFLALCVYVVVLWSSW